MKFTSEEIKLAMTCATPVELIEKAAASGHELTPEAARVAYETLHGTGDVSDDMLENLSAGASCSEPMRCSQCGGTEIDPMSKLRGSLLCAHCGAIVS